LYIKLISNLESDGQRLDPIGSTEQKIEGFTSSKVENPLFDIVTCERILALTQVIPVTIKPGKKI
jgi:hypothetical protein